MNTHRRLSAERSDGAPIRILHISPTDTEGGAAMGAYGMHKALQRCGADSLMLVQRKYSDDPSVITQGAGPHFMMEALRDRFDRLPLRLQRRQPDSWWTVGLMSIDVSTAVRKLDPDIVQFHWGGRGAAPIETLKRIRHVPIVWTLRDMWPLTGGCHYSGGCQRFLSGCGRCPQLGSSRTNDLSSWQWKRKHRAWREANITFVALSRWMAGYAKQSPLVFGKPVSVIPNGVDTEIFRPMNKAAARRIWRLPMDRPIAMFGALFGTQDPRKGFAYLRDALGRLGKGPRGRELLAVIFGADSGPADLGIETRYMGLIRQRNDLASLYACADVMVVPSTEENFGKTALEAMACGVPTVAFANTGQLDIIDHKLDGYLAEDRSAEDLARGILWCMGDAERAAMLSRNARLKVEKCFDIRVVARHYVTLYGRLLEARQRASDEAGAIVFDYAKEMASGPLIAPITTGHGRGAA